MASNLSGLTIKDEHLRRALEGREYLLVDGAMGTQMQERGLDALEAVPELLCKTHSARLMRPISRRFTHLTSRRAPRSSRPTRLARTA